MSDVSEIAGGLADGALVARSIEPHAGETSPGTDGHTHETHCLNCGTDLVGPHCHQCGQRGHVHRTISAFLHDLVHGVLHFEGKAWRTLPMLLFRPGKLTREYVRGKRASYISPIALFLFMVLLAFATVSLAGGAVAFGDISANSNIDQEIARVEGELARLEKGSPSSASGTRERADKIANATRELELLREIKANGLSAELILEASDNRLAETDVRLAPRVEGAAKQPPDDPLNKAWKKAKQNPQLLAYKLQNTAYKFGWLLIPISVPFVWLLFPFSRRYRFYDHTVFVTYSLAFALMLLAIVGGAAAWSAAATVGPIAALVLLVHMAAQLKGAYELGWGGLLVRLPLLYLFAFASLAIFVVATVALGVL